MNWQAEFLDNPEIRLTFDHFPFFSKARNYGEQIQFRLPALRLSGGDARRGPGVGGGGSPGRRRAYAPYSKFRVGAAARLRSGKILCGSNQESEVFPAGMCAERSLLFHAGACHADDPIEALAIASEPSERECYPCGQCRQVLLDAERRPGGADPHHHVRCGRCHGGGFGRAAASFHVPVIIRFAITLRFRCSLPKIFCTRTTTF